MHHPSQMTHVGKRRGRPACFLEPRGARLPVRPCWNLAGAESSQCPGGCRRGVGRPYEAATCCFDIINNTSARPQSVRRGVITTPSSSLPPHAPSTAILGLAGELMDDKN